MLHCMTSCSWDGIEISFSTGNGLGSLVMLYNPVNCNLYVRYFVNEVEGFDFISDLF